MCIPRHNLYLLSVKINKQVNKIEREKIELPSLLILGLKVTSDALIGKSTWDALFQPPHFFSKYKYFIFFCFACSTCSKPLSQESLWFVLKIVFCTCMLFIGCNKNLNFVCVVVFYSFQQCMRGSTRRKVMEA